MPGVYAICQAPRGNWEKLLWGRTYWDKVYHWLIFSDEVTKKGWLLKAICPCRTILHSSFSSLLLPCRQEKLLFLFFMGDILMIFVDSIFRSYLTALCFYVISWCVCFLILFFHIIFDLGQIVSNIITNKNFDQTIFS